MSHQIVYTPESQGEKRSNEYSITSDQMKLLNGLMPVGYCLMPKGKTLAPSSRTRDSIPAILPSRKEKKSESRSDYYEPVKPLPPVQPSRILDQQMLKSMRILTKLRRHQNAYPFNVPVDTRLVPNYLSIIREPMDLSTIEMNIQSGVLNTLQEFIAEVRKVWQNAYTFNAIGSPIYDMANSVERYFNRLLAEEGIPVPGGAPAQTAPPTYEKLLIEKPVIHRAEPAIKKKNHMASSLSETPMTMQQKRSLGQMIKKLPHEYLRGVWEIVNDNQQNREELEFDIETLPIKKARHLESYVKNIFNSLESKKLKEVTNQMEQASENESSFIIDSDGSD